MSGCDASTIDFVSNDTASALRVTCVRDSNGASLSLAGATARLQWRALGVKQVRTMTINDAANGIASYIFATGELIPGAMSFEVEVTMPGGGILTSLATVDVNVRREIA